MYMSWKQHLQYMNICSEDDVFNEYLKEMVCNLNENLEQDMTESEEEMEM